MRALVVNEFGSPEVLCLRDFPDPTLGEQDLLIEVHASALNPIDFKIRRGALAKNRSFPFVLGFDVSGIIRAVGKEVSGFSPGDAVYASPSLVRNGANAEFVCVDARTVAPKPRSLDHLYAASLSLVTLTAWEALYDRVGLDGTETVLVQGGGGGVGHIAIQLARLRGCRVLATASRNESMQLCLEMGADVVINYREEDVIQRINQETNGYGCEVVFDCVGGDVFDWSPTCVRANGHMISIAGGGANMSEACNKLFVRNATLHFEMMGVPTMYGVNPEKQGEILRQAAAQVDLGHLRVHVSRVFDLEQLQEAHRLQEQGHVVGKLALRVLN